MKGARGLLINITGGSDITLFEMDQAANRIREEVDEEANIMVGMALDESLAGSMRISVVATGIDSVAPGIGQMPKFQVVDGGMGESRAASQHAHGQHIPPPGPHAMAQDQAAHGAGYIPQPPATPLLSAAYQAPLSEGELALNTPESKPQAKTAHPSGRAMPRPVTPTEAPPQARQPVFPRVRRILACRSCGRPADPASSGAGDLATLLPAGTGGARSGSKGQCAARSGACPRRRPRHAG
jgi:cell division protein FtsZ